MNIFKIAEDEKLYTSQEARKLLGYSSLRYMYQLIDEGKLQAMKIGSKWWVKGEWINDYVRESNK